MHGPAAASIAVGKTVGVAPAADPCFIAASVCGANSYETLEFASLWCVPCLAGMYALAWQVRPGITPEEFWATALQTGQAVQIQHGGRQCSLGAILDPQAWIIALQE
jgi:hypothetical protein